MNSFVIGNTNASQSYGPDQLIARFLFLVMSMMFAHPVQSHLISKQVLGRRYQGPLGLTYTVLYFCAMPALREPIHSIIHN